MTATKLVTAKEFLALPDPSGLPVELVRGVVKDKRAEGATLNLMKIQLAMFLRDHVKGHGLGQVFMGLGDVLQRDPDTVRMIDISFVSRDRRDEVGISDGSWPSAPDLAVMFVSHNERAYDYHGRLGDYIRAGTPLVWTIWISLGWADVWCPDGTGHHIPADGVLDGGHVLPDFVLPVADVFDIDGSG